MSEGTRSLCGREKGRVEGCKARDTLRRAPARQRTWIIKNNKNTISWKMSFVTSYRHANYCYSSHRNARWMRRGQFMQKEEEDDTQKRTHRPSTALFAAFRGSTRQSCKDSAWQQYDSVSSLLSWEQQYVCGAKQTKRTSSIPDFFSVKVNVTSSDRLLGNLLARSKAVLKSSHAQACYVSVSNYV